MIFKPSNKYQIIRQCHNFKNIFIDDWLLMTFSEKSLLNIIFYRAKNNKFVKIRQLSIQNIYLLCDLPWHQKNISKNSAEYVL